MKPVYKIETYTGVTLDHTITREATSIYCKEILTSGVGTFEFRVPAKKGVSATYPFSDIALDDKVKIWLGYDVIPADPIFVGRVTKAVGAFDKSSGHSRVISGLSQGEVLLRRLCKNKIWTSIAAHDIVDALCDDLSLGKTEVEVCLFEIDIQVETERYFDVLKRVSDYWLTAIAQVKNDFYVDINNNLVWHSRPIRTAGVETLTFPGNIISYSVQRDQEPVKNNITVYGKGGNVGTPGDLGRTVIDDTWTLDDAGNWTADIGTVAAELVTKQVGANSLKVTTNNPGTAPYEYKIRRDLSTLVPAFGVGAYKTLNFWIFHSATSPYDAKVRLYAPDSSNYFEASLGVGSAAWEWKSFKLGQTEEYDAVTNPTGPWTKSDSPNWSKLATICFYWSYGGGGPGSHWYDGLYFGHGRFRGTVTDGSADRDAEYVFDNLTSDAMCVSRANTFLYQQKTAPIQITATLKGNTNILVGDRSPVTIPPEGINAANYDVLSVEHLLRAEKTSLAFSTNATLLASGDIRNPSPRTATEKMIQYNQQLRLLGRAERNIL